MQQRKKNRLYVMRCAIWYHLCSYKNVKKQSWKSVTFSKVAGFSLLKVTLLHGYFSRFFNTQMVPHRTKCLIQEITKNFGTY